MNAREYTWREFRDALFVYASRDMERREQLIFRGHSDSTWPLKTTLDRERSFTDDAARRLYSVGLLNEFRRQAIGLGLPPDRLPELESTAFELVARHYGLPSPLMDMTASPYVASFFAFDFRTRPASGKVAVWMVDRSELRADQGIEIVDTPELLRYNRRAIQQRGVFLRVASAVRLLEDCLSPALTKFELPADDAKVALADLDEMGLNSTSLFGDLDGAARTARSRIGV